MIYTRFVVDGRNFASEGASEEKVMSGLIRTKKGVVTIKSYSVVQVVLIYHISPMYDSFMIEM